jgi:hypothetical protein
MTPGTDPAIARAMVPTRWPHLLRKALVLEN